MKRLLGIAFALCFLGVSPAFAVCTTLQLKDNAGATPNALYRDDGAGNCLASVVLSNAGSTATAPVTANGVAVQQGTAANLNATVTVPTWAGGTLGAMANYGTSPGAVLVPGVNSFITNTPTVSVPTWAGGTLGAMANYGTSPGAVLVPGVNAFVTNANANVGNNGDAVSASGTAGSPTVNYAYGWNGATWDRQTTIGNQIAVQVAQTVTASSAYASGNAVGGLMTVANAARVSGSLGAQGTGGILQNVAVNSKSVQTAQMDIFIFNANPSGSTCTDKTAFVLATADFDKVVGVASVPGSAIAHDGWFSGGTGSVGQVQNLAMAYDLSSATSLFACMVTRGTPTFTATTDISVKYNALRN